MKKHQRMATTKKGAAVHLHYKDENSSPSIHADKLKKVTRRRTGTGSNRRRMHKE